MHCEHSLWRVYIQTILKKVNNFLKSTSSTIITLQKHSESRILHCFAHWILLHLPWLLPSPGVYWCTNKQDLLLDLIKKQWHNVLIKEQKRPYLLKDLDKGLEIQGFCCCHSPPHLILECESNTPYSGGNIFLLIKKYIVNFRENKKGIIWLYEDSVRWLVKWQISLEPTIVTPQNKAHTKAFVWSVKQPAFLWSVNSLAAEGSGGRCQFCPWQRQTH